jgi:hypothetical protein
MNAVWLKAAFTESWIVVKLNRGVRILSAE